MKTKKFIKLIISMVVSFVILNIVCFFYYNVPVHSESKTNSTDYIWEKSKFYSRGTEGFAWGKTDANGFNNISTDYSQNPEILVMGTSHTEAFNVSQDENFTYILNELMAKSGVEMHAYNIGVSGHRITTCLNNFKRAVEDFKPGKYVVMEVNTTDLSMDEINQISEGTVKKIHSSANPILIFLQKIPFVRCVYYQISQMELEIKFPSFKKTEVNPINTSSDIIETNEEYNSVLNSMLKKISLIAKENDIKLIVVCNSDFSVDEKGNVIPLETSEKSELFAEACSNNDIEFINMHDAFAENYNETYRLPHGFFNTAVGKGHLNKYGHQVIANELYELIVNLENQKSVEA